MQRRPDRPYRLGDTIAAVATGGRGAIGVVRVSGPESVAVARRLAPGLPRELRARRAYLVWLQDPESHEAIDQGLVLFFQSPQSYTGEDVVEFQVHGGRGNTARVLRCVLRAGARPAGPGEFTLRAFLSGKMDLVEAEGVAELVAAETELGARLAVGSLRGGVSQRVRGLLERVRSWREEVEAEIEFPEEEVGVDWDRVHGEVEEGVRDLRELVDSYARSRAVEEGVRVVLVGRANVGKSSLLNRLVGRERALVDAEPGTTRDVIEVGLELGGGRLWLLDTAGFRAEAVGVEERALGRAWEELRGAHVVVVVTDVLGGFGPVERELWEGAAGRVRLVAVNKVDLLRGAPWESAVELPKGVDGLGVSALTGQGLGELVERLEILVVGSTGGDEVIVVTERQVRLLREAVDALERVEGRLRARGALELVGLDLAEVQEALEMVLGEGVGWEVLEGVFGRFCIGK